MQHVLPRWLRVFNYTLIGLDIVVLASYSIFHLVSLPLSAQEYWGITPAVLLLAFLHACFALFVYPFIERYSIWFANFISLVLFGLLIVTLFAGSNNNLVYYGLLVAFIFFSGMTGVILPFVAAGITWLFAFLSYLGVLQLTHSSLSLQLVASLAVAAAALGSWLVWRRYYLKDPGVGKVITKPHLFNQEQFKSGVVLESITDGVLLINPSGTVEVLNSSAATMLGWTKKEALNLDYRSLLTPIEAPEQAGSDQPVPPLAITTTLETTVPAQQVSLLRTHNDRHMYVDIVASPMFNTSTNSAGVEKQLVGVIAVLRDVDEQKREEEQRSDFISTASHEMRTPVAAIQGYLELALNPKVCTVDSKAQGYLTKAHEATKHLGQLFQDLLTASKGEDGRLASKPEIINVAEFLQEIVEQEKMAAERKGLQLVFDDGTEQTKTVTPLMYVHVDPERLREVVLNLLDNAIKYTQKGMITLGCSLKEQGVVVRVSDTGMGIATEDIPHLFQKFYRTDNSATREIGGTGLGLYICKQIVETMRGQIWVESTVGAGSTFYVELPRVSPDTINQLAATPKP